MTQVVLQNIQNKVIVDDDTTTIVSVGTQGPQGIQGIPGTSGGDHATLTHLDYASAAHTGFAGTGVTNTFTAAQTFQSSITGNTISCKSLNVAPTSNPLTPLVTVVGSTVQAASLQEWQNHSGTMLAKIDTTGSFQGNIAAINTVTTTWPSSQGSSNTFLKNDGSGNLSWASVSVSPGGSNNQIQYNSSGTFAGDSNLTWVSGSSQLSIASSGTALRISTNGTLADVRYASGQLRLSGTDVASRSAFSVGTSGEISASAVPMTVRGASSQTANLEEWQNSSSTVLARIDSTGSFQGNIAAINTVTTTWPSSQGSSNTFLKNDGSGNLSWATPTATSPGGSSGQVQYNNSSAFGGVAGFTISSGNLVNITAQSATDIPLTLKGAASQSGNLLETKDSNGNVRISIDSSHSVHFLTTYHGALVDANGKWIFHPSFNGMSFASSQQIAFCTTDAYNGTQDIGIKRSATNTLKITDGGSGAGYLQQITGTSAPSSTPPDGTMFVDTTNLKLYVRCGGAWKSTTLS